MPELSIVCATFNSASTIGACLESIKNQTFKDFEVIIIDGKSQDNTLEIIKEADLKNCTLISEKDDGVYNGLNKGIKLSKGKWVLVLGSDDRLFRNNTLELLYNAMSLNKDADLIYCKILFGKNEDIVFNPQFSKKLIFINSIHHQGALYNRKLFENFSYNDEFRVSSDYELNLKLFLNKGNAVFHNEIISIVGEYGLSSKILKQGYMEEILIRKKHIKNLQWLILANFLTHVRYFSKKHLFLKLRNSHLIHR